jgi:hypothetical protein
MYIYEKFGSTNIPTARPAHDLSSGLAVQPIIQTPNGSYAPQLQKAIFGEMTYAVQCAFWGLTASAAMTTYLAWRALVGTRAKLYRRRPDNTIEWTWATLINIQTTRTVENVRHIDATLNFLAEDPTWRTTHHGAPWDLDDGHYLDTGYMLDEDDLYTLNTSPKTITLTNGGSLPARPLITINAVPSNITAVTITSASQTDLTYSGTITAGKSLVLDCEILSITNDGTGDYDNLARNAGHIIDGWLELANGTQDVVITITGGGTTSTIVFDYWERFI